MAAPPEFVLTPDQIAFVTAGVSITAASRGRDNMPNLARATGCRVSPDGRRVTLFLAASQSGALLADIRDNGAVAVVFSEPSTHRTLQLKGDDATTVGHHPVQLRPPAVVGDRREVDVVPAVPVVAPQPRRCGVAGPALPGHQHLLTG